MTRNPIFRPNRTQPLIRPLIGLLLAIVWAAAAAGETTSTATDPVTVLEQTIRAEKAALDKLNDDIRRLQEKRRLWSPGESSGKSMDADLEQARLALESVQVNAQSTRLDQTSTQHQIDKLQSSVADLQHRISTLGDDQKQTSPDLERKLTDELQQQSLLALKQQYLDILNERSRLLQRKVELSKQ